MAQTIASNANVDVEGSCPSSFEKKRFYPMDNSVLNSDKLLKLGWHPCLEVKTGLMHTVKIVKDIKYPDQITKGNDALFKKTTKPQSGEF